MLIIMNKIIYKCSHLQLNSHFCLSYLIWFFIITLWCSTLWLSLYDEVNWFLQVKWLAQRHVALMSKAKTRIWVLSPELCKFGALFLWTHSWSICCTVLGLRKSSDGEMYLFLVKIWDIRIHTAACSHFESGCLCRGRGGFHSKSVDIRVGERRELFTVYEYGCWIVGSCEIRWWGKPT